MSLEGDTLPYEGQLVAVVDDDIIVSNAPALFNERILLARDEQPLRTVSGAMEQLFGERDSIAYWRIDLAEAISHPIDVETVQFLANSKIRLSLLINSPGGTNLVVDYYKKLIDLVKKNGGVVDAYIGLRAYSAGQILACLADERFCFDKSKMMLHKPQFDPELMRKSSDPAYWRNTVSRMRLEGFDQTVQHLMDVSSEDGKRRIRKKLASATEDEGNEDDSVYIFGPELAECGVVSLSSENVEQMCREFEAMTGIVVGDYPAVHPVGRFFKNSRKGRHSAPTFRVVE